MIMKIEALFDFNASTCFIDKELVQQHELPRVKKIMPIEWRLLMTRTSLQNL
jgi:hypothetical protein